MAEDIYNACKNNKFISVEDFTKLTKVNKNALESIRQYGLLDSMQEKNQLDLFSMF